MKTSFYSKVLIIVILQFLLSNQNSQSQITTDQLLENTYTLYESMRLSNGMYRDAKIIKTGWSDYHPISAANVGTGLIALCIADKAGYITDAETKVIETLKTILGYTTGFTPDRNNKGYYRHFLDISSGAQAWNSEYSTIDTALLTTGTLFAKKYFSNNTQIAAYADELFLSVDWVSAIDNPTTGSIWLEQNALGNGQGSSAKPFNEYMIVAYLAKKSEGNTPGNGTTAWNVWTQLNNFAYANYWGYQILSDYNSTNSFRSNFVIQFPFYLVPWAHNSTLYKTYMSNTLAADKLYYTNIQSSYPTGHISSYEWGLGAGSSPTTIGNTFYTTIGYHADDINNHPARVVSPHIIAGFLPTDATVKNDLIQMLSGTRGLYNLPTGETLLWRYSLDETTWKPNEIQGVDYSSMLFGLAANKFGSTFFSTYNNYDFPAATNTANKVNVLNTETKIGISNFNLYPNPVSANLTLVLPKNRSNTSVKVYNYLGKLVIEKDLNNSNKIEVKNLPKGVYLLKLKVDDKIYIKKFVKK
ncbi:T9SS type A sorting domain-containing protein [Polaribacter haliotis]|uniref:T9SS type A sorting domain-containing protein n=2 Tax=Polaribacter TaxID=52959 RepID=A0A7L8AG92_9FLAO|nr:T9SS type A sorting domain-containing protein [Polaribacter haliotis]QOD60987.1 T9SS type A sorting domain-containing protein [Polaribacter haliotis]